MAFKLIDAAQERWRAVNAGHLVALVRAGARFECGKLGGVMIFIHKSDNCSPPSPTSSAMEAPIGSSRAIEAGKPPWSPPKGLVELVTSGYSWMSHIYRPYD
jgi:hypothetical protein